MVNNIVTRRNELDAPLVQDGKMANTDVTNADTKVTLLNFLMRFSVFGRRYSKFFFE